jgi:hypothetical protein
MSKKDDYTYPEDTIDTSEYSDSAAKKGTENIQSILMNKRLMAPLGIFLFVFLVNFLFSDDDPVDQAVVNQVEQKPAVVETVPQSTPQIDRHAQILDENSKMIGGFLEQNSKTKQDLDSMNAKYLELEKHIQELSSDMVIIHNQIRNTNASITALRSEIMARKKPVVKAVPKKVVKLQNFTLRAVIDGRAWIRDADDMKRTMTISVGDDVPTYGKVVSIHPVEGLIHTTSGRVIQFPVSE